MVKSWLSLGCDSDESMNLLQIYSRFGHFLEQKMNCAPHFGAKNANKMVFIPHLVTMVWTK